jgi:CheY-like chemotaxis protein
MTPAVQVQHIGNRPGGVRRLPERLVAPATGGRPAGPGHFGSTAVRLLRVLVADDCRDTTDSTAELIGLWGHDARRAYGGADALEAAAEYRPDVLVADPSLRGVDGFELARRVRQLPGLGATLLIAVTGHTGDGHRRRAAAAGFDFYVLKPADPFTLEALLMSRRLKPWPDPAAEAAPLAGCGVLVVDDDDGVRRLLAAGLARAGFTVLLAASGPEAADILRADGAEIDVVLMDVLMPGRDGPASLAALREQDPALRCCFMSGDLGGHTEDGLRELGTGEVLRKPFTLAEAGRVLRDEIRRRDREDAAQDDHWRDDGGQGQSAATRGAELAVDDPAVCR